MSSSDTDTKSRPHCITGSYRYANMISTAAHSECVRLLDLLTNERIQNAYSHYFMSTDSNMEAPNIKKPMDLNTVRKNLGGKPSRCRFKSHEKFAKDIRLVFQNALICHKPNDPPFEAAKHLLQLFEAAYATAKANLQHVDRDMTAAATLEISENPSKPSAAVITAVKSSSVSEPTFKKKRKHEVKPETLMSDTLATSCRSVLAKIMRHRESNITLAAPFLHPVDVKHFPDYVIKISKPMHLYEVQKKLKSGSYRTLDGFAADIRLIFSNCLVYNSDVNLSRVIRNHAITLMKLFEIELQKQCNGTWPGIPERWRCHQILHDILAHRSRSKSYVDGKEVALDLEETAQWFKYPIQTYYNSPEQMPHQYFEIIKHPMDLGTVSCNLHEPKYSYVAEFAFDIKRIFDNCAKYWGNNPHGVTYCESAKALTTVLHEQLLKHFGSSEWIELLFGQNSVSKSVLVEKYKLEVVSSKPTPLQSEFQVPKMEPDGKLSREEAKKKRSVPCPSPSTFFPEKNQCLNILVRMKSHRVKGYNGIEIMTAGPFLHAVDVTKYPDYPKIITEPMDLTKIERKIKNERYKNVHEFAADVNLVFSNCMKYNNDPVEGADIRTMAARLQEFFTKLYSESFHIGERSQSSGQNPARDTVNTELLNSDRPASSVQQQPNTKDITTESLRIAAPPHADKTVTTFNRATTQPSDSNVPSMLPQSQIENESESNLAEAERIRKKMKKDKKKKKKKKKDALEKQLNVSRTPVQEPPAPVAKSPEANTQTQQTVPPRSDSLTRKGSFAKKSKKNANDLAPWEYACERVLKKVCKIETSAKVHASQPFLPSLPPSPMTNIPNITDTVAFRTIHAQLKSHSIQSPKEFIEKSKSAFDSAIQSLNDSDPTSNHAKEMAQHLLWYFNSLCAEQPLLSEVPDKCQTLRRDRELKIRSIPLEIKARECQKLLRGLSSQKYQKNSWPFQKPVKALFPYLEADYFEMIKNPMDLGTIQEKLNSLEFATYGDFIRDVRLVFENAILYNRADQEREGWSVYKAAEFMLKVVEELWGNVTLEVLEKIKRKKVIWKERERLAELKRKEELAKKEEEDALEAKANAARMLHVGVVPVEDDKGAEEEKQEEQISNTEPVRVSSAAATTFAGAMVTVAPSLASGNTRLKLQVIARSNSGVLTPDRALNKVERKAEEKRRKRARKEEEHARKEKRHRTAIAATDDALREAEARSFRRLKRLEMAKLCQLQERQKLEAKNLEKTAQYMEKRKFQVNLWKDIYAKQSKSFWKKTQKKLEMRNIFQDSIESH